MNSNINNILTHYIIYHSFTYYYMLLFIWFVQLINKINFHFITHLQLTNQT